MRRWIHWFKVWGRLDVFFVKSVIPGACEQGVVPYLNCSCGAFRGLHIGFLGVDISVGVLVGYRGRMVAVVRGLTCAAGDLGVLRGCAAMDQQHGSRAVLGSIGWVPSYRWFTGLG